jgi:hypothetical protein
MAYKYYKDNRRYIDALLETGDVVVVNEEVDWDLEMGAIVRRMCEKQSPADSHAQAARHSVRSRSGHVGPRYLRRIPEKDGGQAASAEGYRQEGRALQGGRAYGR